jgi:hypothetical protein
MFKTAVASIVLIAGWACAPAHASDRVARDCANCPVPKVYDSQRVIKTTRTIDRSRVINTTTVVPVVRHVVYVDPKPIVVNFVVQDFRVVYGT